MIRQSMREQMEHIRRTKFAHVPKTRLVGRCLLRTRDNVGSPADGIRANILAWAAEKWPGFIPRSAFDGQPFDLVQAGLNLSCSRLEDSGLWACRFEHLDTEGARTWVTEGVVGILENFTVMGVMNLVSTTMDGQPPSTMPRFIRTVAQRTAFVDGQLVVNGSQRLVRDRSEASELLDGLCDPERKLPVVAVSGRRDGTMVLSPGALARALVGLAHVVQLTPDGSKGLSDIAGSDWSVYNGAVRTYYPGFTLDGEWNRHPFATPARIENFEDSEGNGSEAFFRWLKRSIYDASVSPSNALTNFPDYFEVRSAALTAAANSADVREQIKSYEEQNRLLQAKKDEWQALAENYSESEDRAKAELAQVRAHNEVLLDALDRIRSQQQQRPAAYPTSYAEMTGWVRETFAGRLVLLTRAIRGLSKGVFENVSLVARSIELLAIHYRNMRIGTSEESQSMREAFETARSELGLELSRSITRTSAGDYENEYYVEYVIGQSNRQLLEWHLKKGSGREERHCLRIYFFWDEESRLVVVGSLPGHLTNRLS